MKTDKWSVPILCLMLLFPFLPLRSQIKEKEWKKKWSVEARGGWGYAIPSDPYAKEMLRTHHSSMYSLQMNHKALASDSSVYDRLFGFPSLSVGLLLADYHRINMQRKTTAYRSGTGRMLAVYAAFSRDLFRSKRFSLYYRFENGLGWCSRPYDGFTNEDNEFVGSPLSIYFGFGLYAGYRVAQQWELTLGGEFKHFSNGALDRPNKGINTAGASIGAKYYIQPDEAVRNAGIRSSFVPYFFVDFSAGWDMNSLMGKWLISIDPSKAVAGEYRTKQFKIYSGATFHAAAMYRYGVRYASGIGLDYSYVPYIHTLQGDDEQFGYMDESYSKHVVAIGLCHEVYYKRLAMHMGLAYYLHRRLGGIDVEYGKPYNETLGIKYALTRSGNVYLGYHVRAHLFRADHMEFKVGFRLRTGKGCQRDSW